MECPPASELRAARQRVSQAARAHYPATVIYAGLTIPAAANVREETFALGERGAQLVQNVSVLFCKSRLSVAPRQGDMMQVNGRAFKVVEVYGHNPFDEDWVLVGQRTPGSDA